MKELEVEDKVYTKIYRSYGGAEVKGYSFSTVERVTKTRAILKDGTRLKRLATHDFYNKEFFYQINNGYRWYIVTDEILAEFKEWKETIEINEWFEDKEFTNEEKKQIYHILNKQHD